MSFLRHREIYPSDGGVIDSNHAPAHRLDEFPAGYSLAVRTPALSASASPTASEYAVESSYRSIVFQRTVNSVLTACVRQGGRRSPSTNCAVIRTLEPDFITDAVITASTPNCFAISGSGLFVPLNCITDVREITRSEPISARSAIKISVIPSAKYSCSISLERFVNGKTASRAMRAR